MNNNQNEKRNNSPGGEDKARPVWNDEKRRDAYDDSRSDTDAGRKSLIDGNQSEPIGGTVCTGGDSRTGGGEFAGKIVTQLIQDCLDQLKINQQNIDSLMTMNQSLEAKIDYYQSLLK